jgi:hypothetical protein
MAYSIRATPEVASVDATVTARAALTVAVLAGAVPSIRTARLAGAERLPARSVAAAVTVCCPSPETSTSTYRTSGATTGCASSTLDSMVIRPPRSSTPATRTRTVERNQPALPALPLGVSVSVGAVSSPSVSPGEMTLTVAETRPAA